ncbi:MAG: TIGR00341 family protein [Winogradskyella sp.]
MSDENKFNFSEDENSRVTNEMNKEAAVEEKKEAVKKDAQGLFASITNFLSELLDFRDDTDRDATIAAIKADIPFKGATAWILVCSIMVASVGLNANSTAVVIGAMLISPLMGPILGVGLSIAINDIDTLRKSMINLAVMIVLSLITAWLFFKFFPLSEDTSELLGRTKPDIRDVLIAFFGGLALIIARTKKGTIASVIFGVAIATALMPPLCTAGYGLAKSNWDYFGGAMYLFGINTIFIALATFIVLKVLRFPMLKYANSKKRKRISQLALLIAILVMAWPIYTFVMVLRESQMDSDYKQFLKHEIEENESLWLQREKIEPEKKRITLYFNGEISEATESDLRKELNGYQNINDFDLVINGNKNVSTARLMDLYNKALITIEQRDSLLLLRQSEVDTLKSVLSQKGNLLDNDSFVLLAKDAKIKFSDLESFGYAKMLESKDFKNVDTITVASVRWKTNINDSLALAKQNELLLWLKKELKTEKVKVKRD